MVLDLKHLYTKFLYSHKNWAELKFEIRILWIWEGLLGAVANSVLNSGHRWQRVGGINFYQISAHTLCPGVEQFLHVLKLILNYMLVLRDYCISFVLCFKYFVIKEEQTWVKFYRSWSIRSESGGLNIVNSIHQILNSTPNTASSNIKWNSQYLQLTSQNGIN